MSVKNSHFFLTEDHDRLDALLSRADDDLNAYEEFRRSLLKHVGIEELILMPAAKRLSGRPAALAAKIRLDHAALKNAPDIPPAAHVDGPQVLASVRRAIAAAGFEPLV